MAITIAKIDVATPTNLAAVPEPGGNLASGITYYYRIASFRWCDENANIYSAWSAEVSATTDDTNKQIALTWDAMTNATGYLIQRTTTSGSYSVSGSNGLKAKQATSSPLAINTNNFTDNANGLYDWTGENIDLTKEVPVINISSNANDTIDMSNVYDADVAGGWGVITMLASPGIQTGGNATQKRNAGYFVRGGLKISSCQFIFPKILYTFLGCLQCSSTTTVTASRSHIFQTSPIYTFLAPPDMSSVSYQYNHALFKGTSTSIFDKVVRRPFGLGVLNSVYRDNIYDSGIGGGKWTNSIVGLNAMNQIPISDAAYDECIFEGARFYTQGISNMILWGGSPSLRWRNSKKINGITTTSSASYDIEMGSNYSIMIIDPVFHANSNSAQDNAYISQIVFAESNGKGVSISCNLDLTVLDTNGNPIEGATVTIKDKYGNNSLWVDSESVLDATLTKDTTSITVSNSSVFTVGEYIRFELNCEIMKVTAITDATHITVERARGGVAGEYAYGSGTDVTSKNRILKNIASLTTNSNGNIITTFPIPQRYLEVVYQGGYQYNYEQTLAAQNKLVRHVYSPHTITISKPGYQTKTIQYTMDRRREEVEVLEPAVDILTPMGEKIYKNLKPEDGQNKTLWLEIV